VHCDDAKPAVSFVEIQDSKFGLADACCVLKHRLEHRLQLAGRGTDNLEHVGGSCLLLERFPQLVEQSRVLDSDDGLGGEILYQLDLLLGERRNMLAVNGDGSD